jgi:hypothetical protein
MGVAKETAEGAGNKVLGGRFSDVNASKGADEVGHHVAQNRFNQNIGISRSDGPALLMSNQDHALTRTFRGKGKATMVNDLGLTARQRMALDIKDIRKNFGNSYNKGMLNMISYAKTLPQYSKVGTR